MTITHDSALWRYLSDQQRVLADDGAFLDSDSKNHPDQEPTDYSYIVFPFAKLYEGFIKQLFLDLSIINDRAYRSDHFRIGKALSPNLAKRLGAYSAYAQVEKRFGRMLALALWQTWKEGRNLVFHYFPHNYRALSRDQAEHIVDNIITTMELAVSETKVKVSAPLQEGN